MFSSVKTITVLITKRNRNGMSQKKKKRFKKDPQAFKVRYIFREFHIDFEPLAKESPVVPESGSFKYLCVTTYTRAHFDLSC